MCFENFCNKKKATYNLKICSQKITHMFPPEKIEKSSSAKYGRQIYVQQKKTGHYEQT